MSTQRGSGTSWEVKPETLAWIQARMKRDWPHMTTAMRTHVLEVQPGWVDPSVLSLDDPYLGVGEDDGPYVPGRNVQAYLLVVFAARLRNDWPHMTKKLRKHYMAQRPEDFEASGLSMDAPYLGPAPRRADEVPSDEEMEEFFQELGES